MARAGMADVITRARRMVGDTAGAGQVYTPDEVQETLDRYQHNVRYMELTPIPTIQPGGDVDYLAYEAGTGYWESPVVLVDSAYATVTPTTSDLVNGRWTFAADRAAPLYIVGNRYDVYGAAAELAEDWAAKLKLEIDYDNAGLSNTWMHKANGLRALSDRLRQRAECPVSKMVRVHEA